jgi:hypothetical protein
LGSLYQQTSNGTHAAHIRQTVSKMIGVINRFGASLNSDARYHILNAFVIPKLTYCLPVWAHIDKTFTKAMDHMLHRVARILLRSKSAELDTSRFKATGILPFKQLSLYKCQTAVHWLMDRFDMVAYLPELLSCTQRITRNTTWDGNLNYLCKLPLLARIVFITPP